MKLTPYECYTLYLAIKQHFSNENYDFFQYNGKVRASIKTYNKRNDRYFFEKLSRKYDKQELIEYFVATFIIDSGIWIGDLKQKADNNYSQWKARINSLSYRFQEELKQLTQNQHLYECIRSENNKHSPIVKAYIKGELSLETLFIMDDILHFMTDSEYDPVLKEINLKIKKYRPFFEYNKNYFIELMKEIYVQ